MIAQIREIIMKNLPKNLNSPQNLQKKLKKQKKGKQTCPSSERKKGITPQELTRLDKHTKALKLSIVSKSIPVI
jgi:hypothetical protein